MATLREKLAALDTEAALRLVSNVRPQFFAKVAELRGTHLKGGAELCDKTRDGYAADARRVAAAGGDPQVLAGTAASFRKLRAACMWKAREDLRECFANADRARKRGGTGDIEALCIYDETLSGIEHRIAKLTASRFDEAQATRQDKTHSQRHKLGRLPVGWLAQIHDHTKSGIYGEAVAVGILIPVRPEELANRIRVKLDASGALLFEVKGSKLRDKGSGIASHVLGIGQPTRWLTLSGVDPGRQAVFDWLAGQVAAQGGTMTIGKGLSANGVCSAFSSMSRRVFTRLKAPPSFYALRHAACAELKASGMTLEEVAEGMGHSSILSQKVYGMRSQASGGYVVEAMGSRQVRVTALRGPPPSISKKIRHQARHHNHVPSPRRM